MQLKFLDAVTAMLSSMHLECFVFKWHVINIHFLKLKYHYSLGSNEKALYTMYSL